jgi:hypothetical protein
VRDDRLFAGPAAPAAAYFYSPDRGAEHPAAHMASFTGFLQADGYAGFEGLYNPARTKPGPIVEVACWAHGRRKFYDMWEATKSPAAKEALDRIAEVYAIEDKARFAPAAERVEHRRETAPLLDKFFDWGKATVVKLSGKLELAKAFRYTIDRREALTRFVTDGRLEVDNNVAENAMRGVALGRNYPHLRVMRSSPRRYRKYWTWVTLSASCETVHPAHNSDLLPGPFHQTGGQHGRRDHHPATAACLASAQRSSGLCNRLQRSSSSRSVCSDHPAHLPLLRRALRPLADNRAPCPERGQRSCRQAIRGGTSAAL